MCVYECEKVLQTPLIQITQTPLSINFNYSQLVYNSVAYLPNWGIYR